MTDSTIDARIDEWAEFLAALKDQSDLGQVLITATFIEDQLLRILQCFMVEGRVIKDMVSGPSAIMGTFSSKTQLAYALGLIDEKEYKTINAVRKIRNEFAHNITTDFEDPKIRGKLGPMCWAVGTSEPGNTDGSQIFYLASQRLVMQLMNRSDHVIPERQEAKEWPVERVDAEPDLNIKDWLY